MKNVSFSNITVRITGGNDGNGSGDGPVVILLHGYGAPGDDLVPLAPALSAVPGTRFLFPAAPLSLEPAFPAARAWWHVDWEARERQIRTTGSIDLSGDVPDGLPAARAWVSGLLDNLSAVLEVPGPVILGGFSQGAMLACDVALHAPTPLVGLVLMSPTLVAQAE